MDDTLISPDATVTGAADLHNLGNGNPSLLDPSSWGDGISSAEKMAVSAAASGAFSIYNSFATVSNFLGQDTEKIDTATTLTNFDSDLGQYYVQHKQGADALGFALTSIIPGTLGVKVLNAGQKALAAADYGFLGINMSRASGLLVPAVDTYRAAAATELAQSTAVFSTLTSNTTKAIAAGFGQSILESAAFEGAVAATMFQSPVLQDQDSWDIAKNIAVGTAFGGALGGIFSAAKTFSTIKQALRTEAPLENAFKATSEYAGLSPSDRIIQRFNDLDNSATLPTVSDIVNGKYQELNKFIDGATQEERTQIAQGFVDKYTKLAEARTNKLQLGIRSDIQDLANGDAGAANALADIVHGSDSNQAFANFLHSTEIARPGTVMAADKEIQAAAKSQLPAPKVIGNVATYGENAGAVTFGSDTPVMTLADSLTRQEIKSAGSAENAVAARVAAYKFKPTTAYDVTDPANDVLKTQARYIWADKLANVTEQTPIGVGDIPLQEKAYQLMQSGQLKNVQMVDRTGNSFTLSTPQDMLEQLKQNKLDAAQALIDQAKKSGQKLSYDTAASKVNLSSKFLQGTQSNVDRENFFARQIAQENLTKQLTAKGLWDPSKGLVDLSARPSFVRVAYDADQVAANPASKFMSDQMGYIKSKYQDYMNGVNNVVAKYATQDYDSLWHPTDNTLLTRTNKTGAGATLVSSANSNYGSTAAWAEATGQTTARMQKSFRTAAGQILESPAYKLINNQDAAIEFSALNNKLLSTTERYVIDPEGGQQLIAKKISDYKIAQEAGIKNDTPVLQPGAPEVIPITNKEAYDAAVAHIQLNARRAEGFNEIENATGVGAERTPRDPSVFYPFRPNESDYKYYAVVVDRNVTGAGRQSMIYASSPKELAEMMDKVPPEFDAYTGPQLNEYFKSQGKFDFSQTLHDHYIDSRLESAGVSSNFFQPTDAKKIVNDWMQWHMQGENIFARELVNAKFAKEFDFLRSLGDEYTSAGMSRKGLNNVRYAESTTANPYMDYVKTALNISKISEHPWITTVNNTLDSMFSTAMKTLKQAWGGVTSPADLDAINASLQKYGIKSAYYDAATNLLANSSPAKGALTSFVRGANSILSTVVLRLDFLNSINNAVGANVLLASETKDVIKKIMAGNADAVGELAGLAKVSLPGAGDQILAPTKVIAKAFANFANSETRNTLKPMYVKNGWITGLTQQFDSMLDNLAAAPGETAGALSKKLASATAQAKQFAQMGETFTGNKLAEEMNRFVAADVMRQISDIGVKHGLISPQEQLGYINSFVNRVQGNVLGSQRPLMFQGPLGSALGLFQSYQLNLMQNLLRYVSEGSAKDAAMMMGMQSTLYGLNGLPGFNFINTHLIGTASGNTNHQDLYTSTYGIAGKQLGDWLTYGAASNLLGTNLYTRGDINPRSLTIIPSNVADIPIVSAFSKVFGNLKDTATKLGNGAPVWETFLQGIEHNGVSRPLSGLAQAAQALGPGGQVFSTTKQGNLSAANDLFSLATLARIAGGKPFDEAIANDAVYRIQAYKAADVASKQSLFDAARAMLIGGQVPTVPAINGLANTYVKLGGTQREFNSYMMKLNRTVNVAQSNEIAYALKNPYAQTMQRIMGGVPVGDLIGSGGSNAVE